jgi:hypothetical protein
MGLSTGASAQDYVRATVFCYGWDTVAVSKQNVEDVRKRHGTRIDILDAKEASQFAKTLDTRIFSSVTPDEPADVRLVVDLFDKHGNVRTYYATRSRLYAPGGISSAAIDEAFKNRFSFGM